MANNKKIIPDCNPPQDCFNCPYPDDCHNKKPRTKAESEFIEVAGLTRYGKEKNFPLAIDRAHKVRSGWLV